MKKSHNIRLTNIENSTIDTSFFCRKSLETFENLDVDINHLEKIFTNETYYLAMKIVPLLERKVLYLAYVENVRLNNICRRLKLPKRQVISLKRNAIIHFKNNLATITKVNYVKGGVLDVQR